MAGDARGSREGARGRPIAIERPGVGRGGAVGCSPGGRMGARRDAKRSSESIAEEWRRLCWAVGPVVVEMGPAVQNWAHQDCALWSRW